MLKVNKLDVDVNVNVVLEEYDILKAKSNEDLINARIVKYEKMGRWDELIEQN